ncbi:MAG: HNH endonuclease, partial [Actinomycetota bacterium]|nr:HNH endonuclease [Actinomycetota bacterium]
HRPHVNVVVDLEELTRRIGAPTGARVLDGPYLDAATIERILCDAGVHRVVTAGRSLILDLGRMTKVVSSSQWAALVMRDECCRFPGCDRPSGWCEAHHVVWWSEGGPTRLDNLMLACTRHHHLIHSPGWQAKLLPDASVEVTTPDGRVLTSHPPPRGSPRLPFGAAA